MVKEYQIEYYIGEMKAVFIKKYEYYTFLGLLDNIDISTVKEPMIIGDIEYQINDHVLYRYLGNGEEELIPTQILDVLYRQDVNNIVYGIRIDRGYMNCDKMWLKPDIQRMRDKRLKDILDIKEVDTKYTKE